MTDQGEREPVGSLTEEALRLLEALQARSARGNDQPAGDPTGHSHQDPTWSRLVAEASAWLGDLGDHVATGDDSCRYCPVCQLISAVRGTTPEVRQHLATAASALVQAAAGMLDTRVPDQTNTTRPEPPVQHIDLDGDADWEDD